MLTAFELSIAPLPLSDDQVYALRFHLLGFLPDSTPRLIIDLVEQLFRHQRALRDRLTQPPHLVPSSIKPTTR
jgi:hypothetical protein